MTPYELLVECTALRVKSNHCMICFLTAHPHKFCLKNPPLSYQRTYSNILSLTFSCCIYCTIDCYLDGRIWWFASCYYRRFGSVQVHIQCMPQDLFRGQLKTTGFAAVNQSILSRRDRTLQDWIHTGHELCSHHSDI